MACQVKRDPEVEKAFWNEAKKHLAAGLEPEDVIKAIADKHDIGTDAVGAVLTNKQLFQLTNEAWAKQAKLSELRSTAKRAAKAADDPAWLKVAKFPYEGTRKLLTVGHGGVIPFTHARSSLFIPGEAKIFSETVRDSYSYLTPNTGSARWRVDMAKLRTDPKFNFWSRVGLDIKLQSRPTGMGMSRWTRQSFDALKTMRLKLAKKYWEQIDPKDRTFEMAQNLAKQINHATGTVNTPPVVSKIAGATMFAPKLRFAKYASVADSATSQFGIKRFAKLAAVSAGLLAVNDLFNQQILKNNDRVNWNNPRRADWLRLKIGGMTLPLAPLLETARLPVNAIATMMDPNEENKGKVITKEIASAAHPGINAAYGLLTGKDLATGDTLPFKGAAQYIYGEHRGERKVFGKWQKDKYARSETPAQYGAKYLPIPAQPLVKELTKEGVDPHYGVAFVEALLSGLAGTHAYPNTPYKK